MLVLRHGPSKLVPCLAFQQLMSDSVWASPEARAAADTAASAGRQKASEIGGATGMRVSQWEVAFVEIGQPARIS